MLQDGQSQVAGFNFSIRPNQSNITAPHRHSVSRAVENVDEAGLADRILLGLGATLVTALAWD